MSWIRVLIMSMLLVASGSLIYAQAPDWAWAKRAGGTNVDEGVFLAMDNSGNSYITGNFLGTATFGSTSLTSSSANYRDLFVAKMSSTGEWLWAKKAGGTGDDRVSSIVVDEAGNAYITGYFNSTTITFSPTVTLARNGFTDVLVAKISSSGTWVWARKNTSGTDEDKGNAIALDSSGNLYVTGAFCSTISFGQISLTSSGWHDIFVAKLDTNGNWLWAVKAGGTYPDNSYGVTPDDSGGAYVCGTFQSATITFGALAPLANASGTDVFVARVNTNGVWSWARSAGGSGSETANSIILNDDGSLYVTGSFDSPTLNFAPGISLNGNGNSDIFVAKLSANGVWDWARKAGGNGSDYGLSIASDTNSNLYLSGKFSCPASFGDTTLDSPGDTGLDGYAAKIDPEGNWQWAKRVGGIGSDTGNGIAVDNDGMLFFTGNFEASVDFSGTTLSSSGMSDVYIAKLENSPSVSLVLMPFTNPGPYPAASTLTINWSASGITDLLLQYSLGVGADWVVIETVYATQGSYDWVLPNVTTYQAMVRISDPQNPDIYMVTENMFAIIIPPSAPEEIAVGVNPQVPGSFVLSWEPVDTDVSGEPIVASGYRVYYSSVLSDNIADYALVGTVTDGSCTFTHQDPTHIPEKVFYMVVAFRE